MTVFLFLPGKTEKMKEKGEGLLDVRWKSVGDLLETVPERFGIAETEEMVYNTGRNQTGGRSMERLNVAIDGPVSAGKSTVADAVAKELGILHLDTGAMYRALGLAALRRSVDLEDEQAIVDLCRGLKISVKHEADGQHTLVEDEDVTGLIRTPEVSMAASTVSRYAEVRKAMVAVQQRLAAETDMVLDGRDICTTVLPKATAKIFLTASPEERARRRYLEMQKKGQETSYEQVLEDLKRRDEQDMNRPVEPLRQAEDAILVDSTNLEFDQVVREILTIVEKKRHG